MTTFSKLVLVASLLNSFFVPVAALAEEDCFRSDEVQSLEFDSPCAGESGQPARIAYCSSGRKSKGYCSTECEYCDPDGTTYQSGFTNCTSCLPCKTLADCPPGQVITRNCTIERNAECGCPPCPTCESSPTVTPCPSVTPCLSVTECPPCQCPTSAPESTTEPFQPSTLTLIRGCPANIVDVAVSGKGMRNVQWDEPIAMAGAKVLQSHHPGASFEVGTNTTVIYVFEVESNVAYCSFMVTITEEMVPPSTPSNRDITTKGNTPESGFQKSTECNCWICWIILIIVVLVLVFVVGFICWKQFLAEDCPALPINQGTSCGTQTGNNTPNGSIGGVDGDGNLPAFNNRDAQRPNSADRNSAGGGGIRPNSADRNSAGAFFELNARERGTQAGNNDANGPVDDRGNERGSPSFSIGSNSRGSGRNNSPNHRPGSRNNSPNHHPGSSALRLISHDIDPEIGANRLNSSDTDPNIDLNCESGSAVYRGAAGGIGEDNSRTPLISEPNHSLPSSLQDIQSPGPLGVQSEGPQYSPGPSGRQSSQYNDSSTRPLLSQSLSSPSSVEPSQNPGLSRIQSVPHSNPEELITVKKKRDSAVEECEAHWLARHIIQRSHYFEKRESIYRYLNIKAGVVSRIKQEHLSNSDSKDLENEIFIIILKGRIEREHRTEQEASKGHLVKQLYPFHEKLARAYAEYVNNNFQDLA